jgi:hypothetical protein
MSDKEPAPSLIDELLARPDIDEILGRNNKPPESLPPVKNPSRRKLLGEIPKIVLTGAVLSTTSGGLVGGAAAILTKSIQHTPTSPEKSVEQPTILDELLKPLVSEALRRRKEKAATDPDYLYRVDTELNGDPLKDEVLRVNFLLRSNGTMVRPEVDPITHSAHQIISLDLKTKKVSLISITGDTRGPRAERYLQSKGEAPILKSINDSYDAGLKYEGQAGAFNLLATTFEEMSGLAMDFQMVFDDSVIKEFIDQVSGNIKVDLPYEFDVYKIMVDGVEEPADVFPEGEQELNGIKALQYMKGEDIDSQKTGRQFHQRKSLILEAVAKKIKESLFSVVNFGKSFPPFLDTQLKKEKVKLDFDIKQLINFDIFKDPRILGRVPGFNELSIINSIFLMDPYYGGEGIRTVASDAEENPASRKDLDSGEFPSYYAGLEVPINGNPYGDLVKDFWGQLQGPRDLIKRRLLG